MKSLQQIGLTLKQMEEQKSRAEAIYNQSLLELDTSIENFFTQAKNLKFSGSLTKTFSELKKEDTQTWRDVFKAAYNELFKEIPMQEMLMIRNRKALDQHKMIKRNWLIVEQSQQLLKEADELYDTAFKALQIVENSRKEYVEKTLVSISKEVDRLYHQLHPKENIGSVKLTLKPKVQHSVELSAGFHSVSDINPQALYSESHADSLGLCIFLALAKKQSNGQAILLLDDVLSSADDQHLNRLLELLKNESEHFARIMLTTHYKPWQSPELHQGIEFKTLGNWSLEKGISFV
jgi:hypothetical protein